MDDLKVGVYRHYKGKEYEVLYEALHSETLEEMIVYRALYEDNKIWIRPKKMFYDKVNVDGTELNRFQFIK